jgi:hypothetical protein
VPSVIGGRCLLLTPLLIFTVSPERGGYFNQAILNALHPGVYSIKLRFDVVNTNRHLINVRHHALGAARQAPHHGADDQPLVLPQIRRFLLRAHVVERHRYVEQVLGHNQSANHPCVEKP